MNETVSRALGEISEISHRLRMMGELTVGGDPLTDEDGERLQRENIQLNRGHLGGLFLSTAEDLEHSIDTIKKALG
ncbi:hypothetical protein [Sphingobium yanoikuyae]|uniref:hypothetical protein n=1 Tax=Sphingobium yanoikuyae TaxID=13690 RepID=UPI002FDD72C0